MESPVTSDLRVVVVAGDPLARAGLAALLAAEPGCEIVGQVDGTEYLAARPETFRADVVIWDLGWDSGPAVEQLADAEDSGPPIAALVAEVAQSSEVRLAGANGVLMRDVEPGTLMAALRAVAGGLVVIQPGMDAPVPADGLRESTPGASDLTPREIEVLALIAEGFPNKAIASKLDISEHTVKFHVNAILTKLGAQSRTEAVTRATRQGLLLL